MTAYSVKKRSRDSSVGIVIGYGFDGRGSIPGGGIQNVQIGSEAHPASYPMGSENPSFEEKAVGT
jgi:hypothetical protein